MSNSFWNTVLSALKVLVQQIESELTKIGKMFGDVVNAVITAEESQIMSDAKPFVQQVATNLQNTQPGLNAQDFIAALIAAVIPVLQKEGISLAHTALAIVASTVAHELGISNNTGNAGVLASGTAGQAPAA